MNKLAWTAVAVSLLSVSACQRAPEGALSAPVQAPVAVEVLTVCPGGFTEYGEYYGRVSGLIEKTLHCAPGGSVEAINVKEGDTVAEGQSLGSVDGERVRAAYEVARLNERMARENHLRQQQFFADGSASRVAVDQAELAWLNSRRALLDAEKMLEGALCITPIAGVVVSRFVELQQELPPGSATFTVARLDKVRIEIGVPEQEIDGITVGSAAEVSFAMIPGRTWKGSVQRLAKQVSPDTLTFQAEIRVDNPGATILPGITAKVRLTRRSLNGQIAVPTVAILSDAAGSYVMVARDSQAWKVPVLLGPNDGTRTVILGGLEAGSTVIVDGNHLVSDGARVRTKEQG